MASVAYYRSRPHAADLGLSLEDAFADPAEVGAASATVAIWCRLQSPNTDGAVVLPMSGDVGSQYTPVAGWARPLPITAMCFATASGTTQSAWYSAAKLQREMGLSGAHHATPQAPMLSI